MSSLKSAAGGWSEDDKSPAASREPDPSAAFIPALNPNAASEGYEVSGLRRDSCPGWTEGFRTVVANDFE